MDRGRANRADETSLVTSRRGDVRRTGSLAQWAVAILTFLVFAFGDGVDSLVELLKLVGVPEAILPGLSLATPIRGIGAIIAGTVAWLTIRGSNRGYDAELRRLEQELHRQNRGLCERDIQTTLEQVVRALEQPSIKTRSCLFLRGSDGKLHIAFSYNMRGDPDATIALERYQGCTGHAWATGQQTWADLRKATTQDLGTTWKLDATQIQITKALGSVLSTPVVHPDAPELVIGVLSVDSRGSLARSRLSGDRATSFCLKAAQLLASYLYMGGILDEQGGS